ncbi:MAG: ADP-ribosylglycohydrolase family protein [Methanomicrobia archaeon]|nr:ADP-ribosylglycohydrolase family protein [Methanomicrobia archaeon]
MTESKRDLRSKFIGALLGTAVGDALGAPLEGWSSERITRVYGDAGRLALVEGRYSDDTEQMIGVAESLLIIKGFDGADMARTLVQNMNPKRGYGPGSRAAFERLRAGERWDEAAQHLFGGMGSYGNGAAMRIAPIGLLYHDNPKKLREVAYRSSQITHTHELGKEGAALQAFAIALAVRNEREEMQPQLEAFVQQDVFKQKLRRMERLLRTEASSGEVIAELGNGMAAFDSVPTAIYSFLRFEDFEHSVDFAIRLGGDTDTIGAMTGAICGAYYGAQAIPSDWLAQLEDGEKGKRYIQRLAEELFDITVKKEL